MHARSVTRHFPRLFWQHVIRDVGRHRLLALLNVLSIALGVAVYLAIQIANENANRAFAASVDLVAGKAHLEIRGDVPETLWPEVEKQDGVEAVTGMVEGLVTLPEHPGEYLRILGVDPFSSSALPDLSAEPSGLAPRFGTLAELRRRDCSRATRGAAARGEGGRPVCVSW